MIRSLQFPFHRLRHYPAGIYLLKVNNRNTRKMCEICVVKYDAIGVVLVFYC